MSDDLVLCELTLPQATFAELVDAAATNGFSAISMSARRYREARDRDGLSDADIRARLEHAGVLVAEVDVVYEWARGGDNGARSRRTEDRVRAIAGLVGARSINLVSDLGDPGDPAEVVAERFAALCDRCAVDGLLAHIEYMPWFNGIDLAQVASVVAMADRPNGGVEIDAWHHFRGGLSLADIAALDGRLFSAIQLDDAPDVAEVDLLEATLHDRLLPGEGELDVVGFIRTLDEIGCRAPVGVEVPSDVLAALHPTEAARRVAVAARTVLATARA